MAQGIWNGVRIGDPTFDGFTFGGVYAGATLVKADYPGLRAIRAGGVVTLAVDLPASYPVAAADGARGVLGYAEITATQAGIGASADLTGLAVTVTVGSGRRIRVVLRSGLGSLAAVTANDRFQAEIKEGSTVLNRAVRLFTITGSVDGWHTEWVGAPSAGSHTYKGAVTRVGGTSTVSWGASPTDPSYVLVEDIGPTSPAASPGVELWY